MNAEHFLNGLAMSSLSLSFPLFENFNANRKTSASCRAPASFPGVPAAFRGMPASRPCRVVVDRGTGRVHGSLAREVGRPDEERTGTDGAQVIAGRHR